MTKNPKRTNDPAIPSSIEAEKFVLGSILLDYRHALSQTAGIATEDFHKLLTASVGSIWEPILLTMLNCCYYPCDIRRLPVSALDFRSGTVYFERRKKRTPRVAVLWSRTIVCLSPWLSGHPSDTTVFVCETGAGYSGQGLRNSFRRFRERAGLPKTVTMDQIRDGAYSAAVNAPEVNEKQAKILAGHRLSGETDAYAKRNVSSIRPACKAIEDHYFTQQ